MNYARRQSLPATSLPESKKFKVSRCKLTAPFPVPLRLGKTKPAFQRVCCFYYVVGVVANQRLISGK